MADRLKMEIEYFQVPNEIFDLDINIAVDERKKTKGSKEITTVIRPLKSYEKLIYIYLCRRGNQGSQIFPSYNTIAQKCGIGRQTAIEGVTNLLKNGLLKKRTRKIETKPGLIKNTSNEYFIIKPKKELSKSDLVRQADYPSTPSVPTLVRQADYPSTPGVPYKELIIKNNLIKNNIKYTPQFLEWYELYPNKFDKQQTFKNFKKLIKNETFENIMLATKNYMKYLKKHNVDKQYFVRSTNFVGEKQSYKGYLEMDLYDAPESNSSNAVGSSIKTLEDLNLEEGA